MNVDRLNFATDIRLLSKQVHSGPLQHYVTVFGTSHRGRRSNAAVRFRSNMMTMFWLSTARWI